MFSPSPKSRILKSDEIYSLVRVDDRFVLVITPDRLSVYRNGVMKLFSLNLIHVDPFSTHQADRLIRQMIFDDLHATRFDSSD